MKGIKFDKLQLYLEGYFVNLGTSRSGQSQVGRMQELHSDWEKNIYIYKYVGDDGIRRTFVHEADLMKLFTTAKMHSFMPWLIDACVPQFQAQTTSPHFEYVPSSR